MRTAIAIAALLLTLAGCSQPADVASENLSVAADNFEVERRIVFYNGITGQYILTIEGLCSKGNNDTDKKVSFTCKVGPNAYKKHYLGVSDNVTWFMEQMEPVQASPYHYRVVFRPETAVPDIQIK